MTKYPDIQLELDESRDQRLTAFGKATLADRYMLPNESYQDFFARVAGYYATDAAHARRMYDYISQHWYMPATPSLANAGTQRGYPISCYLNNVPDRMSGIIGIWQENANLASNGGGIGTCWSDVRSIGEGISLNGRTSGIVPFIKVMDSQTLAVSQGSLRRGSAAVYLSIDHPEIEEFIDMRRPVGRDANRTCLNIHHGVTI